MTDEEKKKYKADLVEQTKKYCRIDYEEDDDLIETILDTVLEKMKELIPGFDPFEMTSRQKLLTMIFIKDQYDYPDAYHSKEMKMSNAVSSLLLSEMYRGKRE